MKFESMFDDMLSEETVQSSPSDAEIENENGCISFEKSVQQSVIDDNIDQMLIMNVSRLLCKNRRTVLLKKTEMTTRLKSSA